MRFMMLMIPHGYASADDHALPDAPTVAAMARYNDSLTRAGVLLALDGLHPAQQGTRVSFAGGRASIEDGPFAETQELIGGYWIIQAKSREEAVAWASRCPARDGDVIEVRQVQELSDFPSEVQVAAGITRLGIQ